MIHPFFISNEFIDFLESIQIFSIFFYVFEILNFGKNGREKNSLEKSARKKRPSAKNAKGENGRGRKRPRKK